METLAVEEGIGSENRMKDRGESGHELLLGQRLVVCDPDEITTGVQQFMDERLLLPVFRKIVGNLNQVLALVAAALFVIVLERRTDLNRPGGVPYGEGGEHTGRILSSRRKQEAL